MYRIIIPLISFLFLSQIATAQSHTGNPQSFKLLYYVDDPVKRDYFIPFIEGYLKDISYQNRKPQVLYPVVISLNMLNEKRKIEGKIIDEFIYADRKNTVLNNSRERNKRDAAIANYLRNYDRFLVIKINPFNALIEYQFLMYDVIKNTTAGVNDIPLLMNYRSSSVIIDPASPVWKENLVYAIKQVCPEVNEPPSAQLMINSKFPKLASDTIFVKLSDTINITALITDTDSPKEQLSYNWKVNDVLLNEQIVYGKPTQQLITDSAKVFTIELQVSDGITASKKIQVPIKAIAPPVIDFMEAGNFFSFGDLPEDVFSLNLNTIRDDITLVTHDNCEFLYFKNIWGKRIILAGEDSLLICYSKGNLRVKRSDASDDALETTIIETKIQNSDTSRYILNNYKNGRYSLIRFYPKKKLRAGSCNYIFYAEEQGIASSNLNVKVSFIKIRQLSIFNEYAYNWLGGGKGSMLNAIVGLGWRPFGFLQVNYGASFLFAPSARVRNREEDKIMTNKVNTRLILEFMKPKGNNINCISVQMQQFSIDTKQGKRTDLLWGAGIRTTVPLHMLGSTINPVSNLIYFPNINKRSYMSRAGMFEFSLGIRVHFINRN